MIARLSSSGVLCCTIALLLSTSLSASALMNPEVVCRKTRLKLATHDATCFEKAASRHFFGTTDFVRDFIAYGKCTLQGVKGWAKLQEKQAGTSSSCDVPTRFVDNGNGTVTDNMTRLVWEKKQNLDTVQNLVDPHDADNQYTWSASLVTPEQTDGTVFTNFLPTLNSTCFAGACDWRLPTIDELRSLLVGGYPCATSPCLAPALQPASDETWSRTPYISPDFAWFVYFADGVVSSRGTTAAQFARAVRGGL